MDYSAPAEPRWKLAPGSLTSGGDHLCSERLASGGDHLCTDGSPATATTSAPGSLTSGGGHLSARAMAKRPLLPPPYGS
jgi:hypothetical protein